jgi:hypothetical protein
VAPAGAFPPGQSLRQRRPRSAFSTRTHLCLVCKPICISHADALLPPYISSPGRLVMKEERTASRPPASGCCCTAHVSPANHETLTLDSRHLQSFPEFVNISFAGVPPACSAGAAALLVYTDRWEGQPRVGVGCLGGTGGLATHLRPSHPPGGQLSACFRCRLAGSIDAETGRFQATFSVGRLLLAQALLAPLQFVHP